MVGRHCLAVLFILGVTAEAAWSASGTEGASFLDIPVGGAPAALGSAYTAQANDVYAPVWNPAGLGFLHTPEFTGTGVSYLGPLHYGHAGFVIPLGKEKNDETGTAPGGLGGSIQYLGSGDIAGFSDQGIPQPAFTAAFAAYSLAYGRKISETLSLGATGKFITEKISDAHASAFAADLGLLSKPAPKLSVGAAIANMGTKIKFVNEADSLPLAARLGATYQIRPQWDISTEGVYRKTGLLSGSLGIEWRVGEMLSFRGGYNTSHIKELGGASGVTAGVGLFVWGQEFSYGWIPVGDLGQTHYLSLVFRMNTKDRAERPRLKAAKSTDQDFEDLQFETPSQDHDDFDILKDNDQKFSQ